MMGAIGRGVGLVVLSAGLVLVAAPASAQLRGWTPAGGLLQGWHVGAGAGVGLGISDRSVSDPDPDRETTWHVRLGRRGISLEGDVQYVQIEEAHGTDETVVGYVGLGPQLRPGGGPAYLRPALGIAFFDHGSDADFGYHAGLTAGVPLWRTGPLGIAAEAGFDVGRIPEFWTYLLGIRLLAILGSDR